MIYRYGPKSRTDDFAGVLHESTLHAELAGGAGVPADFEGVDTDGDVVFLEFATEPSAAGKTAADALCAAHNGGG